MVLVRTVPQRTETNHDSNLKLSRPVPGTEVGTRVLGAGHRRGAGSDVARRRREWGASNGTEAPLSYTRLKVPEGI